MQKEILNIPGLEILEDSVEDLVIETISNHPGRAVSGVCLGEDNMYLYIYILGHIHEVTVA